MAYNENLADRVRELLVDEKVTDEKKMFGGLCFMVDDKMLMGIMEDRIMCRIHPEQEEEVLEIDGCSPMDFTGRPMKGYVYVDEEALRSKKQLAYWVNLCLQYNPIAKPSKKKKKQ